MWAAISGTILAIGKFFGWKEAKEINKTAEVKREEVQQIRKERDDQKDYNRDAVRYGTDGSGRVLYPDKNK